jgi:RND family efflux transporter MFP subunit
MNDDNIGKLTIPRTAKNKNVKHRFKSSFVSFLLVGTGIFILFIISWMYLSSGYEVRVSIVSQVYPAQLLSKFNASGYVVAQRKADVGAKITGQLVAIMVKEGSVVKEGQVIARLENADTQAMVEQSKANLSLSKAKVEQIRAELDTASLDFDRKKDLVQSGAVSKSDFDAAQSRYLISKASFDAALADVKSNDAALTSALVALSYSEIRSPFDAVVLTKNADVGDIITPLGAAASSKAAVVSIADMSSLQVEADVSEANLSMVHADQPCDISLDALPGLRLNGVVDTIVPTLDRSKATVLVKVRFLEPDQRVLPEMSAKVGFFSQPLSPEDQLSRIMVSKTALMHSDKGTFVFLAKEDKAQKQDIRIGRTIVDMVEVLGGLNQGDTVVVTPPKGLKDGSKITIFQQ